MNTLQQTFNQMIQTHLATASSDVIHSAAHDLRHGLSFPCD